MSTPKLNRQVALAVKEEAVPGVAETISFATDAIRLIGATEPEMFFIAANERTEFQTGSIIGLPPAEPAGRCARIRLQWAPIGAGAAYTASVLPEESPLLRAAGRSLTVATGVATYAVNDDPSTTLTVKLRISGLEYTLVGAVFESLVTRCEAGQFPVREGVLVGVVSAITEQVLGTVTYDSVLPPVWKGPGSLALGAFQPNIQSVEIDEGLQAEPNVSANAADGVIHYKIVRIRPMVTVSARVPAFASWNPHQARLQQTPFALDVAFGVGLTGNRKFRFDADNAMYDDVQDVAEGEFRNYRAAILCAPHATASANYVYEA